MFPCGLFSCFGISSRAVFLAFSIALAVDLPVHGQLNSRPASVFLIATLESVSLSANPVAEFQPAHRLASAVPISVTAAWAVPAYRTTLRLISLAPGSSRDSCASSDCLSWSTDGALTMWYQPVGPTNLAASRVDRLAMPAKSPGANALETQAGTLALQIEAF